MKKGMEKKMHPSLVLLLLLAIASQAVPHHKFQKPSPFKDIPKLSPRIIGGEHAAEGEIPYQIGLYAHSGWFCGGSLISSEWVLTAGHCGDGAGTVTIFLGSLNAMSGTQRDSSDIHVYPDYGVEGRSIDACLIRIPSVPLGGNIGTVSLIDSNAGALVGESVRASGWGLESNDGGSIAQYLNKVELTVITNEECRNVYGSGILDSVICCGGDNVHATCSGDSGGPLALVSTGHLVGVVSFGAASGCAGPYPLGFARVSSIRDWISSISGV